jgi:hypothetical protein
MFQIEDLHAQMKKEWQEKVKDLESKAHFSEVKSQNKTKHSKNLLFKYIKMFIYLKLFNFQF